MAGLLHACEVGHVAGVEAALRDGADVNFVDDAGWTPLKKAALNGHELVVDVLLERGAECNVAAADAVRSALACAATVGHLGIVQTLLRHHAVVNSRDAVSARAHGASRLRPLLVA